MLRLIKISAYVIYEWSLSCNRGAFLLVAITELENPEGLKSVKNLLKNQHDVLKQQKKNKGASILLKKIE